MGGVKVALSSYTTWRVGGEATIYFPSSIEEVLKISHTLSSENFKILGGGSNLLVSDKGVKEAVIKPSFPEKWEFIEKGVVEVTSSTRSSFFAKKMATLGWEGIEFLTTIPGNIGGAMVQNAGCYGKEMKDVILGAYYVHEGKEYYIPKEKMQLSYRYSIFKEHPNWIITRVVFSLTPGKKEVIQKKIESYRQERLKTQPRNRRSGGSTFKNPPHQKAWKLIDQVGLRGFQYGRAKISEKHPNFIENLGGAKAEEIYFLIRLMEEKVYRQTGIRLEREIILWGEFPEVDLSPYL